VRGVWSPPEHTSEQLFPPPLRRDQGLGGQVRQRATKGFRHPGAGARAGGRDSGEFLSHAHGAPCAMRGASGHRARMLAPRLNWRRVRCAAWDRNTQARLRTPLSTSARSILSARQQRAAVVVRTRGSTRNSEQQQQQRETCGTTLSCSAGVCVPRGRVDGDPPGAHALRPDHQLPVPPRAGECQGCIIRSIWHTTYDIRPSQGDFPTVFPHREPHTIHTTYASRCPSCGVWCNAGG
jgi:hypothetical protein